MAVSLLSYLQSLQKISRLQHLQFIHSAQFSIHFSDCMVGQHQINGGNFSSIGHIISLVSYKDSSEATENSLLSSPLPFKLGYPGDHSDR